MKNLVAMFVKQPVPGAVKTRLQPILDEHESATLYRLLVNNIFHSLNNSPYYRFAVFYTPHDSLDFFQKWIGKNTTLVQQSGCTLGDRMKNAVSWALSNQYQRILMIGSDIPELSNKTLAHGFEELETNDIVLGPSFDGGYYLIGMRQHVPELFDHMPWSTENVFSETILRCHQLSLTVHFLQRIDDIDTPTDLLQYWNQNKIHLKRSKNFHARHLYQFLNKIDLKTRINQKCKE